LPWEAVPAAIIGQVLVKTIIQGIGAFILHQINPSMDKEIVSQ